MSIASEITRLQNAKANIKTAIEAKGVEIPSNATLDKYSDYIEEIPSGGGSVETLNDLNEQLTQYKTKTQNLPNNYETLYNEPKTLYCPRGCNHYAIFREYNNDQYRIVWGVYNYDDSRGFMVKNDYITRVYLSYGRANGLYYMQDTTRYYSTFNTLEECINAIQNNTTEYTQTTNNVLFHLYNNDANSIFYSNAFIYNSSNGEFITSKKISSNETIEEIS